MRKLAIFAFSFSAAVFSACYWVPEPVWIGLGAGLALLCAVTLAVRRGEKRRLAAALVLAGLALGFWWTRGYRQLFYQPARALDGRTVLLSATVVDWPRQTGYGCSVLVRARTGQGGAVTTLLYTDGQGASVRPGDRLETVARCRLAQHSSAGEEITYYTAKGIFLTARAYGRLDWHRPDRPPAGVWPALLNQTLKEGIDAAFPARDAVLVRALVTGNRDQLTDGFTTSLQRTGLSHTVAVSGMHLAFLAGLLSLMLGRGSRRAALVLIPAVLLFAAVAGNTPSVVRAAVMILLLQLAPLFRRERDSATALGTALMLILMQNPFAAAHVGLQLSFGAVAGILLCSEKVRLGLCAHLPNWRGERWSPVWFFQQLLRGCAAVLSATAGAMVLTTPLVAGYFHAFSLISPLSNLLTLWAVGVLFGGGLAAGVLGAAVPGLGRLLALPLIPISRYLGWAVPALGRAPFAALTMDSVYYRAWLVFLYLLLFVTLVIKGKKRPALPLCAGAAGLCLSILLTVWTFQRGALTAVVLDVGQGQSVLLRCGEYLTLVDCGGDGAKNAGDVAADYILSRGGGRLDLLVLTHYHADHAGGVPQLLRRLEVSAIALPDVEEEDGLRQEILELARRKGIEVRWIREDARIPLEEERSLTLFAPLGQGTDSNELGLSVLATAGEFDVLLTGDMGGEVERLLLDHTRLPPVELLVAGHHGSQYATTQALLEAVRPHMAVVSVGRNNVYGHPSRETLLRLDGVGAKLYRTDLHGTVTVQAAGG